MSIDGRGPAPLARDVGAAGRVVLRRSPHGGFRRVVRDDETAGGASSAILASIASGLATNRACLARRLGLAPSTVTVKVNELIAAGVLVDAGCGDPTGGRRARNLRLAQGADCILAAALGRHHARLGVLDLSGALVAVEQVPVDVADGPEAVLEALVIGWARLLGAVPLQAVHGIGVGLPGPVATATGSVDSPAAMPGWHRFSVRDWLGERFGVPVVVDNDANAMALGEHTFLSGHRSDGAATAQSLLFLKAGSAVGCGLVLAGHLHRGATSLAGDIAHVRVSAAGDAPCSCGNRGCLETVSSGASILAGLRRGGVPAEQGVDLVRLVADGDAQATTRVRAAGRLLGETMSAIVNFVNPDTVVLGGLLSTMEPFVAAVRSQLYESCHPLATRSLRIEQSRAGIDAGVLGAGQLALRHVLAVL